ncbi:MAG: DUF4760 domain-containing protein [Candidatus Thorarchaeota archaeon]
MDIQTISVVIAAASVVIGVVTWVIQIREGNKMNQARLLMQINNLLREEKFQNYLLDIRLREWEDFDDYLEKYHNREAIAKNNYVTSFFANVGVLVYNKLLDPKLVHDTIGTFLFNLIGKNWPFIQEYRERFNRPELYWHIEYLYNEMMKIYVQTYGHEYDPQLLFR